MEKKLNCWEYKKCGREPGGEKIAKMGVCPAAVEEAAEGIHNGTNGGRSCWALVGTFCGGKVQGSFASKLSGCLDCEFYNTVKNEERAFMDNVDILYEVRNKRK